MRSGDIDRQGQYRRTLLFSITSQMPQGDTAALAIPGLEARRVGLREPAWVIVDEWNEDTLETKPLSGRRASPRRFQQAIYGHDRARGACCDQNKKIQASLALTWAIH